MGLDEISQNADLSRRTWRLKAVGRAVTIRNLWRRLIVRKTIVIDDYIVYFSYCHPVNASQC